MKRIMLKSFSVLMALVFMTAQSYSLSARTIVTAIPSMNESAFVLDQNVLDLALSDLNELDNYLASNEGVTYSDLQAAGSELILNISDNTAPLGLPQEGDSELPLGIPAFWWGCVLGWVGLLLVYVFTDKDKVQTKKALTGCLISSGVGLVISIVYYVWLSNNINDLQ